jgi:chemotaxis protein MotA
VLLQPAELVIIGGAALGTLLIANPLPILTQILKGITGCLSGSKYTKAYYLETLKMLFAVFMQARKGGMPSLEPHLDDPAKSAIFTKYPKFLQDHHLVAFVCDTLRTVVTGGVEPFDLDQVMELDLDVHHHEATVPVAALTTMADSLPGLGIVAAVLGVVITMGALGGPPEEIGHKVAAALVGTFLGILMCYGFFGPLASNMAKTVDADAQYYHCIRVALMSFAKGLAPIMAVEFARRAIPAALRPSFQETEKSCRAKAA